MQFSISTIYFGVVIKTIGAPKDGLLYHWDSFCLAFCSLPKAAISRLQYLKIHFPDKATLLSQIL